MKPKTRWMIRRDLMDVLAIERESFEFPWTEEQWLSYLAQRNVIGMVAEIHEEVVGMMVYELGKSHFRITNLAVRGDCRRQGIATALVDILMNRMSPMRRLRTFTIVRESNLPALFFFRDMGFKATGLRHHVYEPDTEDGITMERYVLDEINVRVAT